ncbi:small-conductance mechanosensitive channel [Ereboglobus sp. PH5-10]|uniref:mechanosensitive ion channel family protein n=1 Tax=Ereboglobus sp. PH5-10 TaxID=2940629 RepID=UPI002405CD8B|nr:mechanosensitive ion channel domain-containing protein [Ereboglobus sp. PH5-10]MDF9827644.1 small-conductance mechanosensitive channel [Ereboglobus sp. PH5-10]
MNWLFEQSTIDDIKRVSLHIVGHLPKALVYIAFITVLYFIAKRLLLFLSMRTSATFAEPMRRATKYFFVFVGVIAVFGAFEADLGSLWAMIGTVAALIAVGFVAMWSVLSNLSCTVLILFFRPFEVGDDIEFTDPAGLRGKVINLNFAYTTLRDDEGRLLQIPNNLFFQRIVKRRPGRKDVETTLAEQLYKDEHHKEV